LLFLSILKKFYAGSVKLEGVCWILSDFIVFSSNCIWTIFTHIHTFSFLVCKVIVMVICNKKKELSACTEVKHLLGKFCFAGTGCPKIVDQEIFCTYTHKSVIIHAKKSCSVPFLYL